MNPGSVRVLGRRMPSIDVMRKPEPLPGLLGLDAKSVVDFAVAARLSPERRRGGEEAQRTAFSVLSGLGQMCERCKKELSRRSLAGAARIFFANGRELPVGAAGGVPLVEYGPKDSHPGVDS